MDFFAHQDRARRHTAWLVFLFVLAVALIVLAVNAVVALALRLAGLDVPQFGLQPSLALNGGITLGTLGVIGAGTAWRVAQLRGGGAAVASLVGARPVAPDTSDALEKRLVNVVEEMALAAGMPVPDVFVMDSEQGINAFAAGYRSDQAVVTVTRGTLEQLTRDELQGVVAHEFSHIFNGDMRLNVRLLGFLNGILVIGLIGMQLLRGTGRVRTSRDSRGAWLPLLVGAGLAAIGYIGVFFARVIKAAVSRQREFLADASAVQYTRNPSGIAGALDKIRRAAAGSVVEHDQAEQLSHMFFSNAMHARFFTSWLATHPPLEERIRRIDPGFEAGQPPVRTPDDTGLAAPAEAVGLAAGSSLVDSVGQPTAAHLGYAVGLMTGMPDEARTAAHDADGARAIVYALLLTTHPDTAARQRDLLKALEGPAVTATAYRLHEHLARGTVEWRLPLFDLAAPALRALPVDSAERLRKTMGALIAADRRVSLAEYVIDVLVRRLLEGPTRTRVRYHDATVLRPECAVLVALIACAGADDEAAAALAFTNGMRALGVDGAQMPGAALLTLGELESALARLNSAAYAIRRLALRAAAATALSDRAVKAGEVELLRALSAALDCPMPPLVTAPG